MDEDKNSKKHKDKALKPQDETAQDTVQITKEVYGQLKQEAAKAAEYFDQLLRLRAEFENAKKRMEKERAEFIKYANEGLIIEFLTAIDDFERAIDAAEVSGDSKTLIEGVHMIYRHLQDVLVKKGLSKIDEVKVPLDPNLHEAVEFVETGEYPDGTVVEILRKGYKLNGKVIRPATVKVSKKSHQSLPSRQAGTDHSPQ